MALPISFCIPVHNRLYDLRKSLPHLVLAAQAGPPAEVVIIDYNSPDGLGEYIEAIQGAIRCDVIAYHKYTGRNYYHMAHARNLSVMAAAGEYIVIMSADIYPTPLFLSTVRRFLARGYTWLYEPQYRGVIVCQRREFIEAGGYDERFEFYGPEDRDLASRLIRRGGKYTAMPVGLVEVIPTPDNEKIKNYRLKISKAEMSKRMRPIFEENERRKVMVANQGRAWGQWT